MSIQPSLFTQIHWLIVSKQLRIESLIRAPQFLFLTLKQKGLSLIHENNYESGRYLTRLQSLASCLYSLIIYEGSGYARGEDGNDSPPNTNNERRLRRVRIVIIYIVQVNTLVWQRLISCVLIHVMIYKLILCTQTSQYGYPATGRQG